MSLFKRALKSIIRRTSKSLLLFAIVFLLGNLLCAALAISTSTAHLKDDFISQLGAKVDITLNEQSNPIYDQSYENNSNALLKNLNFISSQSYVKFYDIHYTLSNLVSHQLCFQNDYFTAGGPNQSLLLLPYGCDNVTSSDLVEEKMEIIEGRYFNQEELDQGKKVILLSNQFTINKDGQWQSVHVGDKITFNYSFYNIEKQKYDSFEANEYEVIGIIKKIETVENFEKYMIHNISSRVYLPNNALVNEEKQLLQYSQKYQEENNCHRMLNAIEFKLKEPKDITFFQKDFEKDNPLLNYFNVKTSQDIYDKIAVPLNSLSVIADNLIVITSIAVIVLLSLVVFLFIKDRRYEFGILYAMGEKRIKIVSQIVIELLLIGLIAITCALFTGKKLGSKYSSIMIANQKEASQYIIVDDIKQEDILDQYETTFSQDYVQEVYLTTTFVIILSSTLPTAYILHLKPKKILM